MPESLLGNNLWRCKADRSEQLEVMQFDCTRYFFVRLLENSEQR